MSTTLAHPRARHTPGPPPIPDPCPTHDPSLHLQPMGPPEFPPSKRSLPKVPRNSLQDSATNHSYNFSCPLITTTDHYSPFPTLPLYKAFSLH